MTQSIDHLALSSETDSVLSPKFKLGASVIYIPHPIECPNTFYRGIVQEMIFTIDLCIPFGQWVYMIKYGTSTRVQEDFVSGETLQNYY